LIGWRWPGRHTDAVGWTGEDRYANTIGLNKYSYTSHGRLLEVLRQLVKTITTTINQHQASYFNHMDSPYCTYKTYWHRPMYFAQQISGQRITTRVQNNAVSSHHEQNPIGNKSTLNAFERQQKKQIKSETKLKIGL